MIDKRLSELRKVMEKHGIKAYLVPGTDPHQSEYVPPLWQRRQWLSGFTGSSGDLVVMTDKAGLWTDSRYYLQAEEELSGSSIELFKKGLPDTVSTSDWLKQHLSEYDAVGIDPCVFSQKEAQKLEDSLKEKKITLKEIEQNCVDEIWTDRPRFPENTAQPYSLKYSGESVTEKLKRLRQKLKEKGADAIVLTTLDDCAWLYNIRGQDIDYNPVVICYGIVTLDRAELFIPPSKVTLKMREHLAGEVQIFKYHNFKERLLRLAETAAKVLLDPEGVSRWVVSLLKQGTCEVLFKPDPVAEFKALKNQREIQGFKDAHVRDGAAMVNFLSWLEQTVPQGGVTELSAAVKLDSFRAQQELFQFPSFHTISAYNAHAAVVHYSVNEKTDCELKPEGLYLVDSGGQYLDGTTDITRTIALGTPTDEQKDRFTRVLKGHIQLALTRFPKGTRGEQLDILARKFLWDAGLNYGHGTGHGVGYYLNVHEGPHSITPSRRTSMALEPGMVVSNEPGYYKKDCYGIRIESIICVVKDEKYSSSDSDFYTFETLTLCPIDARLIEKYLLTEKEIDFLNDYHEKVYARVSPHVQGQALAWLKNAAKGI